MAGPEAASATMATATIEAPGSNSKGNSKDHEGKWLVNYEILWNRSRKGRLSVAIAV